MKELTLNEVSKQMAQLAEVYGKYKIKNIYFTRCLDVGFGTEERECVVVTIGDDVKATLNLFIEPL